MKSPVKLRHGSTPSVSRAWRLQVSLVVGVLTLVIAGVTAAAADNTGGVVVAVSAEAVSISVTGGNIDFGGPFGSNERVQAHPQESIREVLPPTITNSGNTGINYLDVTFDGLTGSEAACDAGAASWAADSASASQDRFVLRAWASTSAAFSNFSASALVVAPASGTGNILDPGDSPVAEDGAVPLLLELQMPNPPVAGTDGCSISLTVTAAFDE